MAIKLVVAVTDQGWFECLHALPQLAEVNFWTVSSKPFTGLEQGELLLFARDNAIVGGGVFVMADALPCSVAWEVFGRANGAASFDEMRRRIASPPQTRRDVVIGCHVLAQPFFWDAAQWIALPRPLRSPYQTYDTALAKGAALWEAVQARLAPPQFSDGEFFDEQRRFGNPVLIRPRLGQGAFRLQVTDAYRRCCAVTREKTLPALEAAHIRPYSKGGEHRPANGILLRRDIHSLYDLGYVSITPDLTFVVSGRIREEFEDGRAYYALHGNNVAIPNRAECRADRTALEWHYECVFQGR